jgi:hypothetical protein
MLQLLVYSVLARQGTRSTYFVWLAVVMLLTLTPWVATLGALLAVVTVIDAALFVLLLTLSLWRMRTPPLPVG